MAKFINIFPVENCSYEVYQSMHMFLTHLALKYPKYREIAHMCFGYKILDNSLIEEGKSSSIDDLLEVAHFIGAHEIILPDVMHDADATLEAVVETLRYLKNKTLDGKYRLMAVPHGKTTDDFIECFNKLAYMPELYAIGIPKSLGTARRIAFVDKYIHEFKKTDRAKEIHLLGISEALEELNCYEYPDDIRSCDSSLISLMLTFNSTHRNGVTLDLEHPFIPSPYDAWEDIKRERLETVWL